MSTPTRSGPDMPPVLLRQSRWPVPRTPRWLLAALVVLAGIGVAVGWPNQPSTAQRATDLRGFLHSMQTDIESCAGGVSESLSALHAITAGTSHDTGTAVGIARYGAENCSPANSMPMDSLTQYQVPESLASYHLDAVVNDLVTWAFPLAQRVQTDVADILTASSASARASGNTDLAKDQRAMDAERAKIDGKLRSVITALDAHTQPPNLPG
jgi:hypothetical protein